MAKTARMQEVAIAELVPYERNAKLHGPAQIEKIKNSIEEFGFVSPILIDEEMNVIAGHGRIMAAKELGMKRVPAVYIEGLTETQRRAYIIADNKLTELGGWDDDLLDEELRQLTEAGFDINLTGFELELDTEDGDEKSLSAEINPTAALPESRVIICSISAFGTGSEKIFYLKLPQETAEQILRRCEEMSTGEIAARVVEALDAI